MKAVAAIPLLLCIQHALAGMMTSTGVECKFPFIYKGTTYNQCINSLLFPGKSWCGVVDEVPANVAPNAWGYCTTDTGGGGGGGGGSGGNPGPLKCRNPKTLDGRSCHVPFIYNGVRWITCINVNAARPWCAMGDKFVSGSWGESGQWGYCDIDADCPVNVKFEQGPATPPPGGCSNARAENNRKCTFPFRYKGATYDQCTAVQDTQPWCSFDTDYVGNWGYCKLTKTLNGENCKFPFYYGPSNERYDRCTVKYDGTPWCALDTTYQQGRWGHCQLC